MNALTISIAVGMIMPPFMGIVSCAYAIYKIICFINGLDCNQTMWLMCFAFTITNINIMYMFSRAMDLNEDNEKDVPVVNKGWCDIDKKNIINKSRRRAAHNYCEESDEESDEYESEEDEYDEESEEEEEEEEEVQEVAEEVQEVVEEVQEVVDKIVDKVVNNVSNITLEFMEEIVNNVSNVTLEVVEEAKVPESDKDSEYVVIGK